MLTKILRFDVSLEKFCGALKDNFNSARKFWGNEGNLGTSPKITKIMKICTFCAEQNTLTRLAHPRVRVTFLELLVFIFGFFRKI